MKGRLINKFIIGYLCIGLLGFFIVGIVSYNINYDRLVAQKSQELYGFASSIAEDTMQSFYNVNSRMTDSVLENEIRTIAEYTSARIVVINDDYKVVVDSGKNKSDYKNLFLYDFDPLDAGKNLYKIGNMNGYLDSEYITVKHIINYEFSTKGYVTVHYETAKLKNQANERNEVCYITYLFIYVLAFVMIIIFYFEVSKPLKDILKVTKEYERGNFKAKVTGEFDDELGRLSASMNYVANEIDEIEDFQRKFIANVSHDFRSPLTSIKGYIEAMMDGTIPPKMHEKYFKIVIAETERLNKLTSSMLTLNNMSSRGMRLNISEFSINDVVKRTIETFGGICRGKNIQFDLTFSDKELLVKADVDKIQQVLYNLVDNAIKFSNNDSFIKISATEKNDKVYISVKDSGIGIPKEDLPKIWDRFYKSDLSRGKDKKGTGLGLCIVKEIIQAHGSNIDVVSTVSVGTEFIFSLPRVKVSD